METYSRVVAIDTHDGLISRQSGYEILIADVDVSL